jgi:hypothetical protein
MPVLDPELRLSAGDKQLLRLLARMVLEYETRPLRPSNAAGGVMPLTDDQADELFRLLQRYADSREFIEGSTFVELISEGRETDELRELYLSRRAQRGRKRVLASAHWSEFLRRLGAGHRGGVGYGPAPLPYERFLTLENRLLRAANLNPQVIDLAIRMLRQQKGEVDEVRTGRTPLRRGSLRTILIGRPLSGQSVDREITVRRAMSAIALICDFAVLFTTRDWSVVGTRSGMAASSVGALL